MTDNPPETSGLAGADDATDTNMQGGTPVDVDALTTEIATKVAAKLEESDSDYGTPPEGLRWVPLVGSNGLRASVILGIIASVAAAAVTIACLFQVKGLKFHEQMSLAMLALAFLILGVGIPLLLGEAARLDRIPLKRKQRADVETQFRLAEFLPVEVAESVVSVFKGLTATRVVAAVGVLILFTAGFLARPQDPVAPTTPATPTPTAATTG